MDALKAGHEDAWTPSFSPASAGQFQNVYNDCNGGHIFS
jgi:hypothetical protein